MGLFGKTIQHTIRYGTVPKVTLHPAADVPLACTSLYPLTDPFLPTLFASAPPPPLIPPRSLSNALEHLHQSFHLYILFSQAHYTSYGEYIYVLVACCACLYILGTQVWWR